MAAGAVGADPRPPGLMLDPPTAAAVAEAIVGLDAWLDAMRLPGGYGGPAVHWWQDCLAYTGPGLDWRYEGIIIGYLNLWQATGEECWLTKARRAGDDLVAGQLPSGNYRNSAFELNPATGGTPHEAACDLALLRLAAALRGLDDRAWASYAAAAERNIRGYFVRRLWDETARSFRDLPDTPSFVPNKAATLAEALFALARLSGEPRWAERYALPTLLAVLAHQASGGALDGAIHQNSFGSRKVAKFFPYYVARCIPGLLAGWAWSGREQFASGARRAAGFVLRCRYLDGSFPQVIYPGGLINRYPQWIAGAGDILRGLDLALCTGFDYDPTGSLAWLLSGRRADGGFRTAVGFGRARPGGQSNDPRDELPVCGWCDKTFRYLTGIWPGGRLRCR